MSLAQSLPPKSLSLLEQNSARRLEAQVEALSLSVERYPRRAQILD